MAQAARELVERLLTQFPDDTGALVALMLNEVSLEPGEAIYLPAGNIHAYLSGLGLEVMAASDNVLRSGLTSKHVDVAEVLKLTDFSELMEPKIRSKKLAEGLVEYPIQCSEFRVYRAEVSGRNLLADLDLPASAMVVCTAGEVAVSTSLEEREVLTKSEVVFASAAKKLSLSGSGTAFVILGD
jgi:mannose-6-phosphate isomerase